MENTLEPFSAGGCKICPVDRLSVPSAAPLEAREAQRCPRQEWQISNACVPRRCTDRNRCQAVFLAVVSVGCNTAHGFGKDVEKAGEKIQDKSK